jgi:hypothetical protein
MILRDKIEVGTQRTLTRFALLPTEMNDGTIVWLEFFKATQEYKKIGQIVSIIGKIPVIVFKYKWDTLEKNRI